MRSRTLAALAGVVGFVPATVGLAACGQSSGGAPTATTRDRAACTQLGTAYARFNASPGSTSAAVVYRHAITVAAQADNHQLGTAITSWVTAMHHPTGTAVPGAPYATAECQRIGIPLQFHSAGAGPGAGPNAGTTPAPGSPTSKPDAGDNSDSEGGGND
jgi:hypothetical protein